MRHFYTSLLESLGLRKILGKLEIPGKFETFQTIELIKSARILSARILNGLVVVDFPEKAIMTSVKTVPEIIFFFRVKKKILMLEHYLIPFIPVFLNQTEIPLRYFLY